MTVIPNRLAMALAVIALPLTLAISSPAALAVPHPAPSTSQAEETLTIKAQHSSIKSGEKATFTGHAILCTLVGKEVTLQHKKGGKWTNLHSTAQVKGDSSYSLSEIFREKGVQQLRVTAAGAHSATVKLTVK